MIDFTKSDAQNRKKRRDSFESQNDMNFVLNKLNDLYCNRKLSTTEIPKIFEGETGIKISESKCYYLIKKMGVVRGISESVSMAVSTLDYSQSFLTKDIIAVVDGIVIGDGGINVNKNTMVSRISIGGSQKEFIQYCRSLLSPYIPGELFYSPSSGSRDGIGTWGIHTKYHPDLYKMYRRWYNDDGVKIIPEDVSFDPISLMLWYLGDGCLLSYNKNNAQTIYFATNSFSRESIERVLVTKFDEIGIEVSRITSDNRLFLKTKSIIPFLRYIGGESPVKCYSYKFDVEEWRFKRQMRETSIELNIDYNKLANWVKTGIVRHSRSPGGKKVLFSDEEFKELSDRLASGELSREKNKKAQRVINSVVDSVWDSQVGRLGGESDNDYLDRMAKIYIQNGFPYKRYSDMKLQKEWFGLVKSQYIVPEAENIKYRRNGVAFADNFHRHIFSLNRKGKISPLSLFNDFDMLKLCLRENNALSGSLTYAGVHSAVCSDVRSSRLNNFPPLISRDLCNYYCIDGDKVLDPCAGFSGRLIGVAASKRKLSYTGIDPSEKTYYGLVETQKFIKKMKPEFESKIIWGCAENELLLLRDCSFDFCLTSPPYFDTEKYSDSKTQSHIKFDSYSEWRDKFLSVLIQEIHRVLKQSSIFCINVGKFGQHNISDDIVDIAKTVGFNEHDRKYIQFPVYGFFESKDGFRAEPLMIFKK
ncbi:MAG: DNA methyltransferase [Synergistaceae bacterium]